MGNSILELYKKKADGSEEVRGARLNILQYLAVVLSPIIYLITFMFNEYVKSLA